MSTQSTTVRPLSVKVSVKGAVSVYGLGRFPVTLYASQMQQLLENKEGILAFIEANSHILASKGPAVSFDNRTVLV